MAEYELIYHTNIILLFRIGRLACQNHRKTDHEWLKVRDHFMGWWWYTKLWMMILVPNHGTMGCDKFTKLMCFPRSGWSSHGIGGKICRTSPNFMGKSGEGFRRRSVPPIQWDVDRSAAMLTPPSAQAEERLRKQGTPKMGANFNASMFQNILTQIITYDPKF